MMFRIGEIEIDNRIVAAPLAGVTDRAFRDMARYYGCGLVYTEMISDMGLIYKQERTRRMATVIGEPGPVTVQIFGSEPEAMARGAQILEQMGAEIIDINMGCPTPKIVKNGEGAALMRDLPRSREIMEAVVHAVQLPVTVKMRTGWDDDSTTCLELAAIAEQQGIKAVALHPRTRQQFFSGQADWDMIRIMKQSVSIPVIGNGDVGCADDAVRMLDYTGCDAVMIGRAAMGNPFIFEQAVQLVEHGIQVPLPGTLERIDAAIKHLELACEYKGEVVAVREMRKHFSWYTRGIRGAARIREAINHAQDKEELIQAINHIRPE